MRDDKLDKRKKNNNPTQDRNASPLSQSSLEKAGVAAVALGASAALFYRTGAAAKLAGSIDRSYRFLSESKRIASAALTKNTNIDDVKIAATRMQQAWKKIAKDTADQTVSLRTNAPNTLFNLIHSLNRASADPTRVAGKFYRQNNLIAPAKDFFVRNIADNNINRSRKFEQFIYNVSADANNEETVARAIKRANFKDADALVAGDLVEFMKKRDTADARKDFYKVVQKNMDSAKDKLHDIDFLEKNFKGGTIPGKAWSALTDDRAATIEDLLKERARIRKSSSPVRVNGKMQMQDTLDELENLRKYYASQGKEFEKRFLALTPDAGALRHSGDKLYSFNSPAEIGNDILGFGADTLPGKILKLRDIQMSRKAPILDYIANATYDPTLAAIVNPTHSDGYKNKQVEGNYLRIMGQLYSATDQGLKEVEGADNLTAISGKFGMWQRVTRQMAGDTAYSPSSNWLFRTLDIRQDREKFQGGFFQDVKSRFSKFNDKDWRGNVFARFLTPDKEQLDAFNIARAEQNMDYAVSYLDNTKRVMKFLKQNTYELSDSAISQMLPKASPKASAIFESLLGKSNEELIAELMEKRSDPLNAENFINADLTNLIKRYEKDPNEALTNTIFLKTDRTRISASGGSIGDIIDPTYNHESADFWKVLRGELGKEAFLQHAAEKGSATDRNYDAVLDLVSNVQDKRAKTETKRLAHLAMLQDRTDIGRETENIRTTDTIWDEIDKIEGVMNANAGKKVDTDFRETFHNMINENISLTESRNVEEEVTGTAPYNDFIHVKKAIGVIDIVKSMNSWTKFKATATGSVKQFYAGRDNMEDVTALTAIPYFMLSRLSDDMNTVGLGFSRDSMGSVGQLAKNIMTKRILPVAIGATYLEWLDDTSQAATGTSILGAAANGIANADLATRKVLDTVGLTDWLKDQKAINPIMQYWGGKDQFQDYDERKKYYESGYDPVRKGAWWTFGGVQEARGGEIQYWQPSFVRRINSDWQDKALYDGYFDKWSHSWLPTPSNPLSPIRALTDPYWLEERHKDDRPYPLSGAMFTEGTPWGAVLNPTIGAILKPQKEMHTFMGENYRLRNGVDIKSALHALNENIKAKARDLGHQNLIAIKGDQMTPVRFSAFDAPTEDTKVMSVQYNQGAGGFHQSAGTYGVYDGYGGGSALEGFSKLNGNSDALLADSKSSITDAFVAAISGHGGDFHFDGDIMTNAKGKLGVYHKKEVLTTKKIKEIGHVDLKDSLSIDSIVNGDDSGLKRAAKNIIQEFNPMNLIRGQNEQIKAKAASTDDSFDAEEGILTPEKLSHYRPSKGMQLLSDPDTVQELLHAGKGADFVRDASTSFRLITGIYGYMASSATGFGSYNDKQIATGADMTSFYRSFWDSNLGGAGGEVMEIARRFIPEMKRGRTVNPLMNTMPDWMPERFRYGDPYTSVAKGEMRLPGKGFESLNELHSDQFGRYGAFDRFKILADIAPFSPEYKMWREIAKKTIADPELKEEMSEIRERVSQQGKKHEFYDYKLVGKGLDYEQVTVSEILGYGKFRSGSTIYKLAGARVKSSENETMVDVLGKYLHVGETVTVAKDNKESYQNNNDADRSTNAAVFIDGENISAKMIENGDAVKRKGDTSSAAILANYSSFQKALGYVSEVVAHADVPWLSDQFLRVRSPLESYKAEQVYGTPYQSWEHPIDTFLKPAWERAIHQQDVTKSVFRYFYHHMEDIEGISKWDKHLLTMGFAFGDRGAFLGGAMANMIKPGKAKWVRGAMEIGSNLATAGHFITGGNSYLDEISSGASIGESIAKFAKKNRIIGGALGAITGAVYRTIAGDSGEWIPDRIKKKWEMEDYFDRLTYVKYMGLYNEAARKAKAEENVDVEDITEKKEKRDELINNLTDQLKKIKSALRDSNRHQTTDESKKLTKILNKKINALDSDVTIMEGGKWTHSALIYKQAANSTMYGINKDSSWAQIITALPTNDKEYFMEFVKERDPEEREKILRVASPFLKKALGLAWGTSQEKTKDNKEFFKTHKLPTVQWGGWRPDVDLRNVQVKTVDNEAMNLSDFGFYESQLRDPNVIDAPTIDYHSKDNSASVQSNLKKILQGKGLKNVDVNVVTSNEVDTHQIISNIKMFTKKNDIQRMLNTSMEQNQ